MSIILTNLAAVDQKETIPFVFMHGHKVLHKNGAFPTFSLTTHYTLDSHARHIASFINKECFAQDGIELKQLKASIEAKPYDCSGVKAMLVNVTDAELFKKLSERQQLEAMDFDHYQKEFKISAAMEEAIRAFIPPNISWHKTPSETLILSSPHGIRPLVRCQHL